MSIRKNVVTLVTSSKQYKLVLTQIGEYWHYSYIEHKEEKNFVLAQDLYRKSKRIEDVIVHIFYSYGWG